MLLEQLENFGATWYRKMMIFATLRTNYIFMLSTIAVPTVVKIEIDEDNNGFPRNSATAKKCWQVVACSNGLFI